jgi:hypothetical protein
MLVQRRALLFLLILAAAVTTHAFGQTALPTQDQQKKPNGDPIVIDGLWALKFGNGAPGLTTPTMEGSTQTLYFTAGPNHEADGLFGALSSSVAAFAR